MILQVIRELEKISILKTIMPRPPPCLLRRHRRRRRSLTVSSFVSPHGTVPAGVVGRRRRSRHPHALPRDPGTSAGSAVVLGGSALRRESLKGVEPRADAHAQGRPVHTYNDSTGSARPHFTRLNCRITLRQPNVCPHEQPPRVRTSVKPPQSKL